MAAVDGKYASLLLFAPEPRLEQAHRNAREIMSICMREWPIGHDQRELVQVFKAAKISLAAIASRTLSR
jgi:hypothetical protein